VAIAKHNLDEPITRHMRTDFATIKDTYTVGETLSFIRVQGLGEQIVYFYVTDREDKLVGVIPTRRLLTSPLEQKVSDIMERRVVSVPFTFTVFDACEFFVLYRFMAFPVVTADNRLLGIVDVKLYAEEMFDISEREHVDRLFESLGIRLSHIKNAPLSKRFRARFSWLLATVASGITCALLAGVFQKTLVESVVLSFFLAMVLGLGESVCVQALSLSIEGLHQSRPRMKWFLVNLWREVAVSFCMGVCAALLAGGFSYVWNRHIGTTIALVLGITFAVSAAAVIGFSIPVLLHRLKLDLKIASGPVALAIADIVTIMFYLSAAAMIM
jgi:magnesium transporter